MKFIVRFFCFLMSLCLIFTKVHANNSGIETTAKSVILIEQSTGQVLYENNADEQLPIASVTKIMTMLLNI
jgi:D-alanyl-D-alanine carboxypeptidase (penicillin-binding protein 5/6)